MSPRSAKPISGSVTVKATGFTPIGNRSGFIMTSENTVRDNEERRPKNRFYFKNIQPTKQILSDIYMAKHAPTKNTLKKQ
jgi:hypothetical protein